jgi:hypothetical protein
VSNPHLEAALEYAAKGWPVFPLKPRKKVPATPHGLKDASVDPEQIREWWTRTPSANIGFATGHGVVILDVDDLGALTDLQEDANAPAFNTSRTETSEGRYQLFFRTTAAIRNSAGKLRPGLDVRGDGGYVVLPPSVHPSGHVYRWDRNGTPDELPEWLLELLTSPPKPADPANLSNALENFGPGDDTPYGLKALEAEAAIVAGAQEGYRRDRLNTAALKLGGLIAGGYLDEHHVRAELHTAARLTGLPEAEIETTIDHAIEDGKASPRTAPEQVPRRRDKPAAPQSTTRLSPDAQATSASPATRTTAGVISRLSLSSPLDVGWPDAVEDAALHGIVGEYVRLVDPHTEADPAAILLQTLVLAGSAIGRRPYVPVEADRHHTNLDAVLIGETAKARKGTSLGHAQRLVVAADPEWSTRIVHGLSSGEGLIYAVRDPRYETGDDGEEQLVDAGVTDKRLQVVEPEFVSVLKVASRDGSTLTAMLRQAWDNGDLRTLTRREPLAATGAHVSLIGHITVEELRRYLDATEAANGFGNRLLWACVRRSKSLPEGGHVPDGALRAITVRLADAIDFARRQDEVSRDTDARDLWAIEYERLAQGRPGLVGALLARAEAQVLRLALVYALLDKSPQIRVQHLRAALALWDYCERSVLHVFGDSTGNPDADQIIHALRRSSRGLSRTEISNLFGRHLSAPRIGRALLALAERNLAYPETEETGGRPTERWFSYANKASEAKEGTGS